MPFVVMQDQTEIFFQDQGAGKPVVLIHGWPLTSEMWDSQVNFLGEQGLRVITYDRRGFGRSSQPWTGFDYDTLAADLNAVLEVLDIENATLVGFSMGGGEVVRYLSRYGSSRIARAMLVSAITPFLLKTEDNPEGVEAKVFEGIEQQIRADKAAFLKDFGHKLYGRSVVNHTVSEELLAWNQNIALTAPLRSMIATAKAWSTTDFRSDMKQIDIPVRVIHGTADATVPIAASGRRSARLLPNATLTEYEGEPHGLFITAAQRFSEELLQFVGVQAEPISAPKVA